MRAEAYRALGQVQAANADLQAVITITRARLQEAEQSLTGRPAAAQTEAAEAGESAVSGILQALLGVLGAAGGVFRIFGGLSPIILWTMIGTGVLVLAALVFIVVAGGQ